MVLKEELVYKPTTEISDNTKKWKEASFQSLKLVEKVKLPKDGWFMYFVAFVANMATFTAGIGGSWTSPVMSKLKGPDSPLNAPVGVFEVSFIAASLSIGQIIGPLIFGYFADKVGRKKTIMMIMAPQCLGLLTLAFATDVRLYYLARFLHGLGFGGCFTVLTTYLAEISQQHSRGKFSCSYTLFISLGIFYPYPVGSNLSIKLFCLSCLIPSLIFFAFFPAFVPESPLYLLKIGEEKEAEKALMKLRGKKDVAKELERIREFVESNNDKKGHIGELLRDPIGRKALIIGCGLVIAQHLTGIAPFLAFLHDFFEDASQHGFIAADVGTSIIALIKALIVFVTSAVIERMGRKTLLFASVGVTSLSTASLALYYTLKSSYPESVESFWWFPLPSLTLFMMGFNFGSGPVSWAIISEIFPSNLRSVASSVVFSVCFLTGFIVILAYRFIVEAVGLRGTFAIFSAFGISTAAFVNYMVPETKGKSFTEIQEMLVHH